MRIVTDHGWLMLPGGLSKVELPEHLTVTRKGRCARLDTGSRTDYQTVPWMLDKEVGIAVAPGSAVFQGTDEYEHGGLSPQECVVPVVKATARPGSKSAPRIAKVTWRGLRLRVSVQDAPGAASVDLRKSVNDPSTSLVTAKKLKEGAASLPVEDDRREGEAAVLVVLDGNGKPVVHASTVVGG